MVVTDDNFASIAAAVEEGRSIYENIRKAVHYLLSCNLSEVLVMLGSTLLGWPLPLLPIHILWINLVTDGFPALALAVDPKDPDVMKRPPRDPKGAAAGSPTVRDRLRSRRGDGGGDLGGVRDCPGDHEGRGHVCAHHDVYDAGAGSVLHAFTCRHDRFSLFQIGITTNRMLVAAVSSQPSCRLGFC